MGRFIFLIFCFYPLVSWSQNFVPPTPSQPLIQITYWGVAIAWDVQAPSQSYTILRGTSPEGPFFETASTPGPQFLDRNVKRHQTYYYRIVAVDSGQESIPSPLTAVAIP